MTKEFKVFIVNGAPRTGKDTFIRFLTEITEARVCVYSSIDWAKETALSAFNWNGVKDPRSRKLLSDIKDLGTEWADIPFKRICDMLTKAADNGMEYFCTNIREPQEIQKLQDWCDSQGIFCKSVFIRRLSAEISAAEEQKNSADVQCMNYDYSYEIRNETDLASFQKETKAFIQKVNKEYREVLENDLIC